jgi:hypothetical protein
MDFCELRTSVDKSMRMAHIYQADMLRSLQEKDGKASVRDIAMLPIQTGGKQVKSKETFRRDA